MGATSFAAASYVAAQSYVSLSSTYHLTAFSLLSDLSDRAYSYRLGLFGFAASPHLREEAAVSGEAGTGNYGQQTPS